AEAVIERAPVCSLALFNAKLNGRVALRLTSPGAHVDALITNGRRAELCLVAPWGRFFPGRICLRGNTKRDAAGGFCYESNRRFGRNPSAGFGVGQKWDVARQDALPRIIGE